MNIIINGASRGIGKEVALILARDKDNQLLITGRDELALKSVIESSLSENVSYLVMDLTRLDLTIEAIKDQIYNRFSRIDILINCAGALILRDFMKMSDNEGRIMMETNFIGPAAFIRLVVPLMSKGSHIVNISSMGGFQGSLKYRGMAYYSASKAAIACLTECLAVELSDNKISVNCLSLGSVQTQMFESAFPGHIAPVQQQEMADYISWFALNGNKFFNGKVLPVAVSNP
jgi:NAD(P)-dependent dehydrogenase (short-subunit alcohol dehydrogenase family)